MFPANGRLRREGVIETPSRELQSRSCGIIRRSASWLGAFDELGVLLARPGTAAAERWCATRERIMRRRNPEKLVREAIDMERANRVLDAVGDR
jgi:hypothetical protein